MSERLLELISCAESEDELLSELAGYAVENSRASSAEIFLEDPTHRLVLRASTDSPDFNMRLRMGMSLGIVGEAFKSSTPCIVRSKASRLKEIAAIQSLGGDAIEVEGSAAVPLGATGVPFGVILLKDSRHWPATKAERESLSHLGVRLGLTILAYRKAYQQGSNSNRLGALTEVSRTIASSPYLEEILQLLVNLTAKQFNYRVVTVRLLDEARQELVLRATQAPAKAYSRKRAIKLGESMAGRAMIENRTVIVPDVQVEEEYIGHDLAVEQGLRSMICVPLAIQDHPVGVLTCYTAEIRNFEQDEVDALETLAKQAAVSIEHAKLQVRHTLMQEMHHRVKNSLQQVASLLQLQARHGSYKSLQEALDDCLSRILAIAAVHDLLSREDLDHVGIRSIAEMLVQHQETSLILPDRKIQFRVRGDDAHLNMTQATQIALILNELVQNAVEHGFKETASGEIHINVEFEDDQVGVWVSNNGDKLPPGFKLDKNANLGMQIVDSLARSLGGHFLIEDRLGWTVAEVKFVRAGVE